MNNIMETVTIRPKKPGMMTALTCQTKIDDRWYVLTENFLILTPDELRTEKYKREKMMVIDFDGNARKTYRFSFTPNKPLVIPKDATEQETKRLELQHEQNINKQRAATDFFAQHMLIKPEGLKNPYMSQDLFLMEFQNQKTINQATINKNKFRVYKKLDGMSKQERYDAALYFKPDLHVKRHSEVMVALGDFNTGILMNEPLMSEFLHEYDKNPLVVIQTYVSKALQLNIIRKEEGLGLFFAQDFLGKDAKEAALYFHQNDRTTYDNLIVKEVNAKLQLPEDDMEDGNMEVSDRLSVDTKKKELEDAKEDIDKTERQMLIARAKALGIKSPHKKPNEDLKGAIAAAADAVGKDDITDALKPKREAPKEPPGPSPSSGDETEEEPVSMPGSFDEQEM